MITYFSLCRAKKLMTGGTCMFLFFPSFDPEYSISIHNVHDVVGDKVDIVVTSFKENARQLLWGILGDKKLKYLVDENEAKIIHDPKFVDRFQVEARSIRIEKNKVSNFVRECDRVTETFAKPNVTLTLDGVSVRFSHYNNQKGRFVTGRIYEEENPILFSVANTLKALSGMN